MLPNRENKTRAAKWAKPLGNRPAVLRYAMAAGFVLLALGIACPLEPLLGYRFPLIFFVASTLGAAWCAGFGPGLLALVSGFLVGDFFFVPPLYRFGSYSASDFALLMAYSSVSAIGLAAITHLHHSRQREEQTRQWNLELEQRVRERTEELEAFCYSMSHDLRAPLRSITSFTQLLEEEYESCFNEDGQNKLRMISQSAMRMDRLLHDLLKLYGLSHKEMRRRTVNLSALALSIAQSLQKSEPWRSVKFTITPNLTAQGDEALLRIALENLLNNAWKFTGKRAGAQIEFGSEERSGQRTFFVHDNGVGFSMAHTAKLFGVFERLHSDAAFPGTGIGLALVQRVIIRHGGQIWARATPNQGATFSFTLSGHNEGYAVDNHRLVGGTVFER